jgi:hypothetical protein
MQRAWPTFWAVWIPVRTFTSPPLPQKPSAVMESKCVLGRCHSTKDLSRKISSTAPQLGFNWLLWETFQIVRKIWGHKYSLLDFPKLKVYRKCTSLLSSFLWIWINVISQRGAYLACKTHRHFYLQTKFNHAVLLSSCGYLRHRMIV